MPLPTGEGSVRSSDSVIANIEAAAKSIKSNSQRALTKSQTGSFNFEDATHYFNQLGNAWWAIEGALSTVSAANLNKTAQSSAHYGDLTLDLVAEANAVKAQIDVVLTWIFNNIDKTNPLTFNAGDKNVDWTTYTAGQSSGLRAVVNDLIALLD